MLLHYGYVKTKVGVSSSFNNVDNYKAHQLSYQNISVNETTLIGFPFDPIFLGENIASIIILLSYVLPNFTLNWFPERETLSSGS